MRVSVVIPAHDAAAFLAAAIASAHAQSEPPLEVIVVDDGSHDDSAAIAQRLGARVERQDQAGAGAARNRGVQVARGELVAFLDADDLLPRESLRVRADALRADPTLDIAFGHGRRFRVTRDGEPVPSGRATPARLPGAMLVRVGALERVGPFTAHTRVSESLDWLLRAREAGLREHTVAQHTLWRRIHAANTSRNADARGAEFPRVLKASLDRRRLA